MEAGIPVMSSVARATVLAALAGDTGRTTFERRAAKGNVTPHHPFGGMCLSRKTGTPFFRGGLQNHGNHWKTSRDRRRKSGLN
jgi:hypothetical protein